MPAISVSVKGEVYIELEAVAKATGFTKSKITEKALEQYFAALHEDMADANSAENAWNEFTQSGKQAIPAEEVYKEAGL